MFYNQVKVLILGTKCLNHPTPEEVGVARKTKDACAEEKPQSRSSRDREAGSSPGGARRVVEASSGGEKGVRWGFDCVGVSGLGFCSARWLLGQARERPAPTAATFSTGSASLCTTR